MSKTSVYKSPARLPVQDLESLVGICFKSRPEISSQKCLLGNEF